MILTQQRLVQLTSNYPALRKTWYIVASSAFASCNRPQEVAAVYDAAVAERRSEAALVTAHVQEALLKAMVIMGVPRAINSLSAVQPHISEEIRSQSQVPHRDFATRHRVRGEEYFKVVYNKVTGRVVSNLQNAYPDLYTYIVERAYGDLISYTELLDAKNSSLAIIGALVPQDVNPQLKGHLRGALNVGNSLREVNEARDMALLISQWCSVDLTDIPHKL